MKFKKYLILLWTTATLATTVNGQGLYFPPTTGTFWETIPPSSLGWCADNIDSLYHFLEINNTKAFLLLKDGKIVLEHYFDGHTEQTPWQWASAGKTLTAFTVGIAQQENLLSIYDTVSTYLGNGWTNCSTNEEEAITLWHQLTMTSGLDETVPDPNCLTPNCLLCLATPGTRWAYHNPPYTLLDGVLENATGMSLNSYINQRIKTPTGMTGAFLWIGNNNVFFSNARSMARFGLLNLNRGYWDNTPVLTDSVFFNEMVSSSQALNESYGYLWWLNGKATLNVPGSAITFPGPMSPNAPMDTYMAMGKDGQFLNVVPSQNVVMVRMGGAPTSQNVPFLLNDSIWRYINDLPCAISTEHYENTSTPVQIFPNPGTNYVTISAPKSMVLIELSQVNGQLNKSWKLKSSHFKFDSSSMKDGVYMVQIYFEDGKPQTKRWVKIGGH